MSNNSHKEENKTALMARLSNDERVLEYFKGEPKNLDKYVQKLYDTMEY